MFYTEITKIIEAGMRKDPTKVASYSRLLARKLSGDGSAQATVFCQSSIRWETVTLSWMR